MTQTIERHSTTAEQAMAAIRKRLFGYDSARLHDVVKEIAKRQCEALKMYRPMPHIEAFHACQAPERILRGSNRSGKAQPVDEPVLTPDGWKEIGKLSVGDVVIGGDGLPCTVTGVYPQGIKPVFQLTFSDGASTRCCEEHLWKVRMPNQRFGKQGDGEWSVRSLAAIRTHCGDEPAAHQRPEVPTCIPWMPRRTTPMDPYVLGLILGDGSVIASPSISTADDEVLAAVEDDLPPGYRLRKSKHYGKKAYDYIITGGRSGVGKNAFKETCCYLGIWGQHSWEKGVPKDYLFNSPDVRLAVLQGLMDTDGTISTPSEKSRGWCVSFSTSSPGLADDVVFLVRSLGGRACRGIWSHKKYTYRGERRTGRPSIRIFIRMLDHCPFRLRRKASVWESWRKKASRRPRLIRRIESAGTTECVCISVSSADHTYVTRDLLVTHNTLGAAVEFARAVTGQDPHGKWPKRDGLAYVVGASNHHIGSILHRILFRAGAFKMIADEKTGMWRAYRPWEPADKAREKEAKPAPPLIPHRFIKSMSWENKKESVVKVVQLKNGWEIRFCPSGGEPPQGFQADLAWFDEEILHPMWYGEVAARGLVDRNGRFFWSATAQKGGPQLYEMCERAAEEKEKENPRVVEFFAHINDNRYFTDEQRDLFFAKLSEEERLIRIEGEFAFTSFKVYPEFDRHTHAIDWFDIPSSWTRYMIVDPGRQVCAVLFAAVPPPDDKDPDRVVLYDEIYLRQATARAFGEAVKRKTEGQQFEDFLIDHQGGRVRDAGRGLAIEDQYAEELKRQGVKCRRRAHGFLWGSTDIKAGIERVRSWLLIRDNGTPKMQYIHDRMQNFWHEMTRYHWKRTAGGMKDLKEEPEKRNDHLVDCMRYLAMFDPKYVKPSRIAKVLKGIPALLKQKEARRKRMHGDEDGAIRLGPQGGREYA